MYTVLGIDSARETWCMLNVLKTSGVTKRDGGGGWRVVLPPLAGDT
jgi:hypothetical protein